MSMDQSQQNTEDNMIDQLKEELQDENRGGIISALRLYSPLNLKGLAKLLGKAESTLHPHFKRLKDNEIVVLDQKSSQEKPGKYYQLDDKITEYFESRYETTLEEFETEIGNFTEMLKRANQEQSESQEEAIREAAKYLRDDLEDIHETASSLEAAFTVNKSIQSIIYQNIRNRLNVNELTDEELVNRVQEPGSLGTFTQVSKTMSLVDLDDVIAISSIIVRTMREIEEVIKQVDEKIRKNNIPKDEIGKLYLYLFTGPIANEIDDNEG